MRAFDWQYQTLEAAPGQSQAEQLQLPYDGRERVAIDWFQRDREEAAGTEKVPLPDLVPRMLGKRGVQNRLYGGVSPHALGKFQSGRPVLPEPNTQCANPAQREIDVVGAGGFAEGVGSSFERPPGLLRRSGDAEQSIGVPTRYFVAAWMDTSTPCSKGLK